MPACRSLAAIVRAADDDFAFFGPRVFFLFRAEVIFAATPAFDFFLRTIFGRRALARIFSVFFFLPVILARARPCERGGFLRTRVFAGPVVDLECCRVVAAL